MAEPTLITVTGTLPGTGNTTGSVSFQSTVTAAHVSDDSVLLPGTWTAAISGGTFTVTVPASNDPAWSPTSWTYRVRIRTAAGSDVFDTVVPYNAPGATIGINQLVPVRTASGLPAVTGSRGGNAALASLLTTLAGLGLLTDSTTA